MTEDKSKKQQDRDLDEELEESFPASDPPSSSTPGAAPGAPDHRRSGEAGRPADERPVDPGPLKRGSGGMPIRER